MLILKKTIVYNLTKILTIKKIHKIPPLNSNKINIINYKIKIWTLICLREKSFNKNKQSDPILHQDEDYIACTTHDFIEI